LRILPQKWSFNVRIDTIAFALSADCFAVSVSSSIAIGVYSRFQIFRTSILFGSFQALMPFLGWLAGSRILELISKYDHWFAFGLLAFVDSRMIWQSIHDKNGDNAGRNYSQITTLLVLSLATSLDALAVGFGLSFMGVSIALSSAIIGAVAFAVTTSGFLLGTKLGKLWGRRAEIVGGAILVAIGISVLTSHIL